MLNRSESESIASNYFRSKRASQILNTDPMKNRGKHIFVVFCLIYCGHSYCFSKNKLHGALILLGALSQACSILLQIAMDVVLSKSVMDMVKVGVGIIK